MTPDSRQTGVQQHISSESVSKLQNQPGRICAWQFPAKSGLGGSDPLLESLRGRPKGWPQQSGANQRVAGRPESSNVSPQDRPAEEYSNEPLLFCSCPWCPQSGLVVSQQHGWCGLTQWPCLPCQGSGTRSLQEPLLHRRGHSKARPSVWERNAKR